MEIIVTGSLGHIGRPLIQKLLQKNYTVTVVSRNVERRKAIEQLGAQPAIGSLSDVDFLTQTFQKAEAAFCMNPPNFKVKNQHAYYENLTQTYAAAIEASGLQRVVYLSSYGAHLPSGTGFISGSYLAEQRFDQIPNSSFTYLRPASFYYNLLAFIPMIKALGYIGAVYGGNDKLAMAAPEDIAAAASEELVAQAGKKKIRYICSDDRSCNEIAAVLGEAIGKPDLQWKTLSEKQVLTDLLAKGLTENAAKNLVELGMAIHTGKIREDFDRHKPALGKVRLEEYAKDFAVAFHKA